MNTKSAKRLGILDPDASALPPPPRVQLEQSNAEVRPAQRKTFAKNHPKLRLKESTRKASPIGYSEARGGHPARPRMKPAKTDGLHQAGSSGSLSRFTEESPIDSPPRVLHEQISNARLLDRGILPFFKPISASPPSSHKLPHEVRRQSLESRSPVGSYRPPHPNRRSRQDHILAPSGAGAGAGSSTGRAIHVTQICDTDSSDEQGPNAIRSGSDSSRTARVPRQASPSSGKRDGAFGHSKNASTQQRFRTPEKGIDLADTSDDEVAKITPVRHTDSRENNPARKPIGSKVTDDRCKARESLDSDDDEFSRLTPKAKSCDRNRGSKPSLVPNANADTVREQRSGLDPRPGSRQVPKPETMPRPAPRPSPLPQLDDTSSSSDEALTKKRVVRESSSTRPLQPTKRVRGKAPSSTPEPHAPKSKPLSNSSAAPALSIRDTPQSSARPKYTTAIAIQDTPEVGDVQIVTNNSASSPEHTPTHPRASKTGAVRATFGKNISPTTASAGDLEEHASTAAGAAVEIVDSSDFSDGDSLDSGYDKALRCPSCQRHLSDSLSAKAMDLYSHLLSLTPGSEQYYMQGFEFCRRHKAEETTIPEGIRRGYPTSIDFKRIKMRVRGLLSEIKGIVSNPETSYFRTLAMQAYSSLGKRHAQGVEYKLRHSQQLKCGYYGMLGTSIIFKTLIELLTRGEKPILKYRTTKPQTVFEFIQDVLVPEVASRLILQDCQSEASRIGDVTNLAEARQVMQESSEFGWALHGDWSDEESSD